MLNRVNVIKFDKHKDMFIKQKKHIFTCNKIIQI